MIEGRVANSRSQILAKLNRLAERAMNSVKKLGFTASSNVNLDGAKVFIKAGGVTITADIYDEDDISVKVPASVAKKLDIASYASIDSISALKNYAKVVASKISA